MDMRFIQPPALISNQVLYRLGRMTPITSNRMHTNEYQIFGLCYVHRIITIIHIVYSIGYQH